MTTFKDNNEHNNIFIVNFDSIRKPSDVFQGYRKRTRA